MHVHIYVYMCACTCIHACMHLRMYVCMYGCLFVCLFVYVGFCIYIHKDDIGTIARPAKVALTEALSSVLGGAYGSVGFGCCEYTSRKRLLGMACSGIGACSAIVCVQETRSFSAYCPTALGMFCHGLGQAMQEVQRNLQEWSSIGDPHIESEAHSIDPCDLPAMVDAMLHALNSLGDGSYAHYDW